MRSFDLGETVSSRDIKMIVEQNNYTNLNLYTISKQLKHLENLVENQPKAIHSLPTNIGNIKTEEPIFKPLKFQKIPSRTTKSILKRNSKSN